MSAELTGTSQLAALLFAPLFGFLSEKTVQSKHTTLLLAAVTGIIGYLGFSLIDNPEPSGSSKVLLFATVILQGISQIGAIVCSLGLLGRTILDPTPTRKSDQRNLNTRPSGSEATESPTASPQDGQEAEILHIEPSDSANENTLLLPDQTATQSNLAQYKGSIAGVYSLSGGIGILVLTKAGGLLFDKWSNLAPFYILALFNFLLLFVGLILVVFERRYR